jgi:hypothetical protein
MDRPTAWHDIVNKTDTGVSKVNTIMFSVVNAVLLQSLYPSPERLIYLTNASFMKRADVSILDRFNQLGTGRKCYGKISKFSAFRCLIDRSNWSCQAITRHIQLSVIRLFPSLVEVTEQKELWRNVLVTQRTIRIWCYKGCHVRRRGGLPPRGFKLALAVVCNTLVVI